MSIKIYCSIALATLLFTACQTTREDFDATGSFEAVEVIVSAEGDGKIMSFNVDEGDELIADEIVGYIDTTQLYLKREQLMITRSAIASRSQDISKQIAATTEQIQAQERELRRTKNLIKLDAATQKQYDDISSNIVVLKSQLVAQESTLQKNNRGISYEMRAYLAQVDQINDKINKAIITSPIKGTVIEKYAEYGEFAGYGRALFKVADVENMFLRAYITSGQLENVKLNQEVKLYSDYGTDFSREYKGRIVWIANKAEFTPKNIQTKDERANLVYAIKVALRNDGYVKIGMYGVLKFE